jgi:hypothetical protein
MRYYMHDAYQHLGAETCRRFITVMNCILLYFIKLTFKVHKLNRTKRIAKR